MLPLIPLLPFLGYVVNALFGRRLSKTASGTIACASMLGAFLVSVASVWSLVRLPPAERAMEQVVFTWIGSGELQIPLAFYLDPLASLMILVVTGIGFLIHVYSTGYMHEEPADEYARYFSYLNLFAAFMLVLVLGSNFPVMFVGWEGVGLCSYLLIGFWYRKKENTDAGNKAFIVNRIGDFAFILGMLLAFVHFGTLNFQEMAAAMAPLSPEATFGTLSIIALLLFIGATGKSAQIPLYVWLPDAMAGPTPVSALIHAATMVTAGVYMIGRTAVLYEHAPIVLGIVAVIGVATALFAGTMAIAQYDIKRVLAYSTVSQLGYMFLAMGVGAYAAGIFHLYTHAFFKALLFLGSGAVIHALAGEQDIRRMGGLKRDLPITYWTFLIGAMAISGVPLLSGFFSKDEILLLTFTGGHHVLWLMALLTAFLTAVYMFRLVFLTFHGERFLPERPGTAHLIEAPGQPPPQHPEEEEPAAQRAGRLAAESQVMRHAPVRDHHAVHLHDAPPSMAVPLIILAIGSVLAGYVGVPHALGGGLWIEHFLQPSFLAPGAAAHAGAAHQTALELMLMAVTTLVALGGIALAAFFFLRRPEAAEDLRRRFAGLHRVLANKYYVDEAYDAVFVRPVRRAATDGLWRSVDVGVIDGAVNGTGALVRSWAGALRRLQSGSIRTYAASLFIGVVLLLAYYLWP